MRNYKYLFCVIFFLGIILFIHDVEVKAQGKKLSDIGTFVDELMEEKVEENHIPNAAVTVVYKGDLVFSKGYGFTDLESKEPVHPEMSLFRIGSISKLFTWTAIMQLVEQNKLDLDTDINEYIDFDIPVGPDDSGPITLRHLLTHTPGFEDYADSIFKLKQDEMQPLEQYVQKYLPERVFPAGEIAAYSNYGTVLAGYIVEKVSGIAYSDYIERNILEPLQMERSTFQQPVPDELRENLIESYRYVNGEFLAGDFEYMPAPAGGMSSSATDMAKFMKAILKNDGIVLSPETLNEMTTQQFIQHPYLDGITFGFIERTMNDKRLLTHSGSTMIFDSGLYLLPEEDLGIFVTYSGGNYTTHTEIINEVMHHYYPLIEQNDVKAPSEMKERAKEFVGEYHQNRRSFTTSEKFISLINGAIHVGMDDKGYLSVTHMGSTNSFVEIDEGIYKNLNEVEQLDPYGEFSTIVFERNSTGITTLMTDGPMSYSKVPWYASSGFTFISLIISIFVIVGTMIFWMISWFIQSMRKRKRLQPKLAVLAKGVAVLYGIFTLIFLLGFGLNSEMSPIYGLPTDAFSSEPVWKVIINVIPYFMVLLSMTLLAFMFVGWQKKIRSIFAEIHYTTFTIATIILSWLFYFWNII